MCNKCGWTQMNCQCVEHIELSPGEIGRRCLQCQNLTTRCTCQLETAMEYFKEINWRTIAHKHSDILHHDTCPLCIMEQALYGGKD